MSYESEVRRQMEQAAVEQQETNIALSQDGSTVERTGRRGTYKTVPGAQGTSSAFRRQKGSKGRKSGSVKRKSGGQAGGGQFA